MSRIKRGKASHKRKIKVLKAASGFRWRRKSTFRAAKQALIKAGTYAYRDRRAKKRTFRSLWILRLSNALRPLEINYSLFTKALKDKKIELDRKVLSQLAVSEPEIFVRLVEEVKK